MPNLGALCTNTICYRLSLTLSALSLYKNVPAVTPWIKPVLNQELTWKFVNCRNRVGCYLTFDSQMLFISPPLNQFNPCHKLLLNSLLSQDYLWSTVIGLWLRFKMVIYSPQRSWRNCKDKTGNRAALRKNNVRGWKEVGGIWGGWVFRQRVLLYEQMEENLWSFGAYLKLTKIVMAEVRTHPVKKLSLAWKT